MWGLSSLRTWGLAALGAIVAVLAFVAEAFKARAEQAERRAAERDADAAAQQAEAQSGAILAARHAHEDEAKKTEEALDHAAKAPRDYFDTE